MVVAAALLVMLLRFLMMVLLFMVLFAHHGFLSFIGARFLMVALLFMEVCWLGRICIDWCFFGLVILNLWLWLLNENWLRLIGLRQSARIGTAIIFAGMIGRGSHIH